MISLEIPHLAAIEVDGIAGQQRLGVKVVVVAREASPRHCHVRCVSVTWEERSGEYRNAVV
jgi:hypothetical protein